MNKGKFLIPVLAGLMIGQLFAESERPFGLANTIRFGYSDNIYRNQDGKNSPFVTDIIDFSFRAALSDRTDVTVKSKLVLLDDDARNSGQIYPNLYAMLNHNISPRLLFRLSEYYRSGEQSGDGSAVGSKENKRYNYFYNEVGASADYVLTEKDRLEGSLSHAMLRHDSDIEDLDYVTVGGGVSWKRELVPQRTFATLNLRQSNVNYDKYRSPADKTFVSSNAGVVYTNTIAYDNDNKTYDQTVLSVGLNHTFNQEWQGHAEAGVGYVQRDFSGYTDTETSSTNSVPSVTKTSLSDSSLNPLVRAGLVYSPSPRTRLTGDFSLSHQESDDSGYGGQDTAELRFGAQHDLTAKLMARATASFANVKYDSQDATTADQAEKTEDRMNFEFRLTYKLNRINFLEAGVMHREVNRDVDSWKENRADIGWRVELN